MGKGYLMAWATLWPRLPYRCALLALECWRLYGHRLPYGLGYLMGARWYALNVDGFMGKDYLIAKATYIPSLSLCSLC